MRIVGVEEPRLVLEEADQIGMQSLETLLADFLIPNYSNKCKDIDAVGEMGNGSYQMYRNAEMVTVKTRTLDDPSRVYFLRIIPIRHLETGEVIDLWHKCVDITDITEPEFVGTTLRVRMRGCAHPSKTALEFEGIAIRNFIKETFSVANPSLGDNHKLQCELKLPNGVRVQLEEIDLDHPICNIESSPFPLLAIKCNMISIQAMYSPMGTPSNH